MTSSMNRPLTDAEMQLVRWMLEHGKPEATAFLPQLEKASVTPWRCPCGCASIEFAIDGHPKPQVRGLNPVADFTFGPASEVCGIFVYEVGGVLGGVEVYGMATEAPRLLPGIESLVPWEHRAT